jgi:hypothetical protein
MADEEKEKADKVAAAKKRVGDPHNSSDAWESDQQPSIQLDMLSLCIWR